ncbi:hypothetical protein ACFQY0_14355 [Haloferula chungangensis]|uniref:Uncharacterized protein n=1 Tax=Haloferula chungangensis TaxID=1048331 RepID=A0ABW2LBN1_9BACT
MKTAFSTIGLISSLTLFSSAAIQIPGADGSSGVLNITADTTIDLSQAVTGNWDDTNTANGIYDAEKWAVVFNYSSVNIDPGVTLTFTNHESRAPVVWLVTGDVVISGNVSLDGQAHQPAPLLSEPGPGGFRGGTASYAGNPSSSAGFGPGGGLRQGNVGSSGAFGTNLGSATPYGNPSLIPLIGGSGGAGDPEFTGIRQGGGAGAGAILIACAGTATIDGQIHCNGGAGLHDFSGIDLNTGGGSGGGIRIVCDTLAGTGPLNAVGGDGWQQGGLGRIRIERVASSSSGSIVPDPSIVPLTADDTALLWPPPSAPQVEVVSIGGVAAPADPRAAFGATGADVALPETATTEIVIRTTNVEQAAAVNVRLTPRSGADSQVVSAVVSSVVSPTEPIIEWTADLPVNTGYSAVQVHVVRP